MLQLSDPNFMPLFLAGDKEAFKLIFDTYYVRLIGYASKSFCLKDESLHEEFVLHAFESLYKTRQKYESENHIRRSLYIMTKNKGISHFRTMKKKHQIISQIDVNYIDLPEDAPTMINEIKEEMLRKALASLPKWRYIIIKALFFDNLPSAEVAQKYNLSKQTVRNTKAQAIAYLKNYFSANSHLYATTKPF